MRAKVNGQARAAFICRCFRKIIEIPPGFWNQPLDEWQTSFRLADVLRRVGVRVLGDLHGRRVGDFAWERNCGFETLHELDSLASVFASHRSFSYGAVRGPGRRSSEQVEAPAGFAELRHVRVGRGYTTQWTGGAFVIPESVSRLRFNDLPITKRLANVCSSVGLRTLGDVNGRTPSKLLQLKQCGWRTIGEIQQLIERAISGEFDVTRIKERTAAAELMSLVEQGMAKLPPQEGEFLLGRIEGLTFGEIGRGYGLTRARVHQVVVKALDTLRKTYGPRIPRLLEMVKRRCLSILNASGLTPALLDDWIVDSSRSFKLSRKAQVRLIAALDKNIPCSVENDPKAFGSDKLDLMSLKRVLRLAMAPENPRGPDAWLCEQPISRP